MIHLSEITYYVPMKKNFSSYILHVCIINKKKYNDIEKIYIWTFSG